MQERKKRRIVIASILKPIDDTRMFEKIGQTLASRDEVHIVGYPSKNFPSFSDVHFHPSNRFERISVSRLLVPIQVLRKIFSFRPSLLIVTTHELLGIALIAKLFLPLKIIYDVQENYFRNLLYTKSYPFFIRWLLAIYVRTIEWLSHPFINQFFLAERAYQSEISFIPEKKSIVLENKYKGTTKSVQRNLKDGIRFLFSGTLAESTGVFTAIELAKQFFELDHRITLTIVGHCAHAETRRKLSSLLTDKPYITLLGGDALVPHQDILREIEIAHVGIIAYPRNPSTENSMPTKLYEYLALQLPILLIDHASWKTFCAPFNAAVTFKPSGIQPAAILQEIRQKSFYTAAPSDVLWANEAQKLLAATL